MASLDRYHDPGNHTEWNEIQHTYHTPRNRQQIRERNVKAIMVPCARLNLRIEEAKAWLDIVWPEPHVPTDNAESMRITVRQSLQQQKLTPTIHRTLYIRRNSMA